MGLCFFPVLEVVAGLTFSKTLFKTQLFWSKFRTGRLGFSGLSLEQEDHGWENGFQLCHFR